jgi:aromatic ring-cleaving dioxygenase
MAERSFAYAIFARLLGWEMAFKLSILIHNPVDD